MISTLIRLGKQLKANSSAWDDILDSPNLTKESEKNIKCFVGELVFDLDRKMVYTVVKNEKEYTESDCAKYKNIKIVGGNNKAIYCCTPFTKTEQLRKTFFGTTDGKGTPPQQGQLEALISKDFPQFSHSLLFSLLAQIFALKNKFETQFTVAKGLPQQNDRVIDEKLLFNSGNFDGAGKIVLLFASVISTRNGLKIATPVANIAGYDAFIKARFFDKNTTLLAGTRPEKLCYATGNMLADVYEVDFTDRFSLNKMFVKGTKNYATGFNTDNFGLNYQVNTDNQRCLTRASKYLLETQKIKIAGIDHCILPQFLSNCMVDVKQVLAAIHTQTNLLFDTMQNDEGIKPVEIKIVAPFWINYLAFETDGNFFKTINEIRNISHIYLYKLLNEINQVDSFFRHQLSYAVDWKAATNEYGKAGKFSLGTIYGIIPVRKDSSKKNDILALYKMIFEARKIDINKIYKHFCTLILCHRYNRYTGYKNIKKYDSQYFTLAIRDAVFKYSALIRFLKQTALLNEMEPGDVGLLTTQEIPVETGQRISLFFKHMNYEANQKAMFYLGRMLHIVAYLQYDKNINLIDKVNFNGMYKPDILQLRHVLLDKAKLFNGVDKILNTDADFLSFFNDTDWNMNAEASVFFLLSGFAFGMIKH